MIQAAVDGDVVAVAGLAVQSVDVLSDEVFVGEPFVHPVGPVMAVGREAVVVPAQKLHGIVAVHGARRHFLRRVVATADGPEAVAAAEGRNPAGGAHAGARDIERIYHPAIVSSFSLPCSVCVRWAE